MVDTLRDFLIYFENLSVRERPRLTALQRGMPILASQDHLDADGKMVSYRTQAAL